MQPLMPITEVSKLLATTPGAARSWLKRMGVAVIDLGPGRGLGKRWSRDEVLAAIEGATIFTQPKDAKEAVTRKPRLTDRPLYGKSRKEQIALILGAGPVQ